MNVVKFKVLKDFSMYGKGDVVTINKYSHCRTLEGNKIPIIKLFRCSPEYFMEIQPEGKEFDNEFSPDKFRYAGRVGIPKDGEWFAGVASRGYAGAVRVSGEYHHYENILYPIEKSPTKQEIITALEGSIRYWRKDILDVLLDDEELAKSNPDRCPLGQLFYEPNKGKYRCGECPIESGCKYHGVCMAFFAKKSPANALAMIEHLRKCKDELMMPEVSDCTFNDDEKGIRL